MPVALVEHLQANRALVAPALDPDRRALGRVFGGVVEEVEQDLLEQDRVELQHRQVGRERRPRPGAAARILLARSQRRADDLADVVQSARFGATAPDSSRVMSRRLAMKRLSRSDSSMMVASSSALAASSSTCREVPQGAGRAQDRGERRLADRARSRSAAPRAGGRSRRPASPARHPRPGARARSRAPPGRTSASSRRRCSGVRSGPGLSLSMPTTPIVAAAGPHGQEQALGAGQGVGAAARRPVVLQGPFRRGEVGLVESVLRRIAGLDGDRARLRQRSTTRTCSIEAIW